MHQLHQCLLPKTDTDWTTLDGGLNKTFYYKDNIITSKMETKNWHYELKQN